MCAERSAPAVAGECAMIVIVLLSGFLMLPGQVAADTWFNVSVVLKSGIEYLDVRIDYDPGEPDKGLLLTRSDSSTINVAAPDIFMILDRDKTKITGLVLRNADAEAYRPYDPGRKDSGNVAPNEVRAMIDGRAGTKASGRVRSMTEPRFKLAISGGVGYGMAAGDWFEGLTNGLDLGGAVRLLAFENLYMGVRFRRQGLGVDNDLLGTYLVCDGNYNCYRFDILDMNVNLNEYCFMVGRITEPSTSRSPIAFFEVGIGGITNFFKMTVSNGIDTRNADSSETKLALFMAGGGIVPFNEKVGFTLEGTMRITGSGGDAIGAVQYEGSYGVLLGMNAGIVVFLGT
jgi:hypothetical protein